MLYPVKVLTPEGRHVRTIPTADLFIFDEKHPPVRPAAKMPFELISCVYCGDKCRTRVSVRGVVRRMCKNSKCVALDAKAKKDARLKIKSGSRGASKKESGNV